MTDKEIERLIKGPIKIGYFSYKIVMVDILIDDEGNEIFGQCLYDICEIRVLQRLSLQAKIATLWHEILHAILVNAGFTGDHDEQMISAIAHGILDMLISNGNNQ